MVSCFRMELDRERTETVVLKISARDGGTSPKVAETSVEITILDVNDISPVFSRQQAEVTVSEHSRPGTKIASLTATDRDKGKNGTVVYSILEDSEHFKIDVQTGDLMVNSDLDRETVKEYDLQVLAADLGQPALTSTMQVKVKIGDINDNYPVFYPERYFVVLQSDFQQQDLVVQLRATDRDEGNNAVVSYDIIEGDSSAFRLEQSSGKLYLSKPLRELSQQKYVYRVSAKDGKGRKAAKSAEVEISVDNPSIEYYSCDKDLYRNIIVISFSVHVTVLEFFMYRKDWGFHLDTHFLASSNILD